MINHSSYTHNVNAVVKLKPKKNHDCTGFQPMTSATPVQCFTN